MKKKSFAWSYSSLSAFEMCPRQYNHYKIAKDYAEGTNSAAQYGLEVHKAFEQRLVKGKELPLDLTHHERVLGKLAAAPGKGFPEQRLAITKDFQPTGWFDDDVWCRAIVDFLHINKSLALILDHKTGRQQPGFDQISLCCAILACYKPEITSFLGAYYWTKTKTLTRIRIEREELPAVWNNFLPRVIHMQNSIAGKKFPARPNYLCKRYCKVKSCEHRGV